MRRSIHDRQGRFVAAIPVELETVVLACLREGPGETGPQTQQSSVMSCLELTEKLRA
jgi:hypothetical protein